MTARLLLSSLFLVGSALAAPPATDAEKEAFLRSAEIQSTKTISTGITRSRRAMCVADGFEHDAHVQSVDEYKSVHRTARGTEVNFRDYYGFNIAAYRLDRLLGLGMVPVSVMRKVEGDPAAVTWWIDDFQMLEKDRWRQGVEPPDRDAWNRQMWKARVFNELAYNTDANLGNVVIDGEWKVWLIDFTRAFRLHRSLREPKNLEKIERGLLERLRTVTDAELEQALGEVLRKGELRAVLARRDRLVEFFDERIAADGEAAVVYEDE